MITLSAKMHDGDGLVTSTADRQLLKEKKREAKKELNFYDAQVQEYEPINKNLYIESKEISEFTQKEVAEFRKAYGDIKVRGINCPRPI